MTPEELLKAFARFESVHEFRDSPDRFALLSLLPDDPQEYVEAATQMLGEVTPEVHATWFDELETYQRFEDILRELLYADRRSAEALLWIVSWSMKTPGLHELGINPLAAFANELAFSGGREITSELLPVLQQCLAVEPLTHNAQACIRRIRRSGGAPSNSS